MWKPVHMVDWEYICEKCGKNYEGKVKIATWVVDEEKYIKGENEP
jgi:DNA-directed RNA polymerase subunit RPC12/RpoP